MVLRHKIHANWPTHHRKLQFRFMQTPAHRRNASGKWTFRSSHWFKESQDSYNILQEASASHC